MQILHEYVREVMHAMTEVLKVDNEENVTTALRVVLEVPFLCALDPWDACSGWSLWVLLMAMYFPCPYE